MYKFDLKLHLACSSDEIRPTMSCIFFDKGKAIASDAYVIVIIDLDDYSVTDEDKATLQGKMIDKKSWAKIYNKEIVIHEDGLFCPAENFKVFFDNHDYTYPNWAAVIYEPNEKSSMVQSIDLNVHLIKVIAKCFPGKIERKKLHINLHFNSSNKGILIFPGSYDYKSYAMLMPIIGEKSSLKLDRETMTFKRKLI